jgi:hypothetical protein
MLAQNLVKAGIIDGREDVRKPRFRAGRGFTGRFSIGQGQTISVGPGQIGLLLFDGTSGQQLGLNLSNATGGSDVFVFNPDGTQLYQSPSLGPGSSVFTVSSLPQTGTFTLMLQELSNGNAGVTVTSYNVPPNASTQLTINGPTQTLTTTTPGQNAQATFTGTSGQSVTVHVTNNSLFGSNGSGEVNLLSTDGSTVLTLRNLVAGNFDLGSVTLPASGTYTIFVHTVPAGPITGSITLGVTNP